MLEKNKVKKGDPPDALGGPPKRPTQKRRPPRRTRGGALKNQLKKGDPPDRLAGVPPVLEATPTTIGGREGRLLRLSTFTAITLLPYVPTDIGAVNISCAMSNVAEHTK